MSLSNRKMRLSHPRLRRKSGGVGGEVSIPAYEAMREDSRLAGKIWDTMMRGVSTRNYSAILPDACEVVGVSKSSISREFVPASEGGVQAIGNACELVRVRVSWSGGVPARGR